MRSMASHSPSNGCARRGRIAADHEPEAPSVWRVLGVVPRHQVLDSLGQPVGKGEIIPGAELGNPKPSLAVRTK